MKKIFLLIILSYISLLAQENEPAAQKSLLALKSEIAAENGFNNNLNPAGIPVKQEKVKVFSKKNAGLAIVYSLLLPGMGELYAEGYESGKYFTIAEGILWGVYIGIDTYGNWQKDRYIAFAASNGGVNNAGKNDDYYGIIGQYMNITNYNNDKALGRDYVHMYDPKEYYWKWNDQDRKAYRHMWVSSEQAFNNLRFVAGALILNRVASAINAVRLVSAYNKRAAADMSWNVSVGVTNPANMPSTLTFNFQKGF
jgi:hypothetical protein